MEASKSCRRRFAARRQSFFRGLRNCSPAFWLTRPLRPLANTILFGKILYVSTIRLVLHCNNDSKFTKASSVTSLGVPLQCHVYGAREGGGGEREGARLNLGFPYLRKIRKNGDFLGITVRSLVFTA